MGWWKQPYADKKICFLCSGKIDTDDYGEIQYTHAEGTDKKRICALCVARLDKDEVKPDDEPV